jgi:hypothetical protein
LGGTGWRSRPLRKMDVMLRRFGLRMAMARVQAAPAALA